MTEAAPAAHFMRFTAPDPSALAAEIRRCRQRLLEAEAAGDSLQALDAAADLGSMLTTDRQEAAAHALLLRYLPQVAQLASHEPAGWLLLSLGTALQYLNRHDEAGPQFAQALATARAQGWLQLEHMVLHHWARALAEQGHWAAARTRLRQALALREALGHARQATTARALDELARWEWAARRR